MPAQRDIRLKRIYDPPEESDGIRVLVDRIWPRGVRKEDAKLDYWMKSIAPSTALRKWFAHDLARWDAFRERYRNELQSHASELGDLRKYAMKSRLTLVFAAKDREHNQAVVIKAALDDFA